jgi:hypothetical protein
MLFVVLLPVIVPVVWVLPAAPPAPVWPYVPPVQETRAKQPMGFIK